MLSRLGDSPASEFHMPAFRNSLFHLQRRIGMKNSSYLPTYEDGTDIYPPMKMEQCVPKRWYIKFRRPRITQKEACNIQNTAKV